uniref:MEmBP-1a n=1 Tax=Arundo donax TaxID=35708 RepID=A0A0A9HJI8_ARUDO
MMTLTIRIHLRLRRGNLATHRLKVSRLKLLLCAMLLLSHHFP